MSRCQKCTDARVTIRIHPGSKVLVKLAIGKNDLQTFLGTQNKLLLGRCLDFQSIASRLGNELVVVVEL